MQMRKWIYTFLIGMPACYGHVCLISLFLLQAKEYRGIQGRKHANKHVWRMYGSFQIWRCWSPNEVFLSQVGLLKAPLINTGRRARETCVNKNDGNLSST
jgi:hypothetical protein